jgi:hypothetical protein
VLLTAPCCSQPRGDGGGGLPAQSHRDARLPNGRRYQNPGCKAYELCSFNDGDRFCWTAQAQLISKVYLKKHPTLPRCYTLNAKDKKMVNDFWKARS